MNKYITSRRLSVKENSLFLCSIKFITKCFENNNISYFKLRSVIHSGHCCISNWYWIISHLYLNNVP